MYDKIDKTQYKLRIVAKAITYAEELTGTNTGNYLKFLLESMQTNESFYFGQLEGAVIEAEGEVDWDIIKSKLRIGQHLDE
jgi:hypothetical protein